MQLGLWITKNAGILELGAKICAMVSGTTVGWNNASLEPSRLRFSSADRDGMHIRRRIMDNWSVGDNDLRFPLWAVETLLVHPNSRMSMISGISQAKGSSSSSDDDGGGGGSGGRRRKSERSAAGSGQESPPTEGEAHLLKIVQRTSVRGQHVLVGNASLLRVHADASSEDVVRAICLLCMRSCPGIFGGVGEGAAPAVDTRAKGGDETDDASADEEPWAKMLKCGTVRYTSCTERSQVVGIASRVKTMPLGAAVPASTWMTKYTTLCFDWQNTVAESVVNANHKSMISMHKSYATPDADTFQGDEKSVSLTQCLNEHTQPENVCDMTCENCGGKDHTKALSLSILPPVLMISLKRFENIQRKNCTLVTFPLRGLDMSPWLRGGAAAGGGGAGSPVYDLVAVLNHKGQLSYGHYTAYGLTGTGAWAMFDDEVVDIVEQENLVSNLAYVLVYARRS